jgi:branched-chain amino acid transport system substrate-binding protein
MNVTTVLTSVAVGVLLSLGTAATAVAQDNTINVAHSGALSGPYSEFGIGKQNGVELAIDKWNKRGGINGKQIVLKYNLDDQVVPDRGVQNHRKIFDDPSVVGVIAPGGSSVSLAIAEMVSADGRPFMNAQSQAPAVVTPPGTDRPYKNVFSTAIQNDVEATVLGQQVAKKFVKIGVLHESTGYGATGAKLVETAIKAAKPEAAVLVEGYNQKAQDMTAQIARLKSAGGEAVVVVGLGADMAVIRKNILRLNWQPAFYTSAGGLTPAYAQGAGDLVVGTRAPMLGVFGAEHLSPEAQEFADAYKAKYGSDKFWGGNEKRPQISIALTVSNGYDAANMLFEAIKRANSTDKAAIVAELQKLQDFKGVNATYSFSETNHTGIQPQHLSFFEYVKEGDKLSFKLLKD